MAAMFFMVVVVDVDVCRCAAVDVFSGREWLEDTTTALTEVRVPRSQQAARDNAQQEVHVFSLLAFR